MAEERAEAREKELAEVEERRMQVLAQAGAKGHRSQLSAAQRKMEQELRSTDLMSYRPPGSAERSVNARARQEQLGYAPGRADRDVEQLYLEDTVEEQHKVHILNGNQAQRVGSGGRGAGVWSSRVLAYAP